MDFPTEIDGWKIGPQLGGGGQGTTYRATNAAGTISCLKLLSDPANTERRQRFIREAACYATLEIDGVPRLLASNTDGAKRATEPQLYHCTQLIAGPSLDKVPVIRASKTEIIASITNLTRIIHDLHKFGIVHRDIKPQNLMARNGHIYDLCVIDFGLAFSSVALDDYETETGQELGNRFLRLPELQAGSRTKQDPTTDLTFCAGILFYMITGVVPRSLFDGQGKMPHQRDDVARSRLYTDREFRSFLPVFDKAFKLRIQERYESAGELVASLIHKANPIMAKHQTLDEIIAEINEPAARVKQQRMMHCDDFIDIAHTIAGEMARRLDRVFICSQTAHIPTEDSATTQVGFALKRNHDIFERVPFEAKIIGAQIVATAWNDEIFRTDADAPNWGPTLGPAIEQTLVTALNRLKARIPPARPD